MIGVTPADNPVFKDFSKAAIDLASDTILIRAGLSPEMDNPVTVDVAVRTPAELLTFRALHFMERENGDLWLCAEKSRGPAMKLGSSGLELRMRQTLYGEAGLLIERRGRHNRESAAAVLKAVPIALIGELAPAPDPRAGDVGYHRRRSVGPADSDGVATDRSLRREDSGTGRGGVLHIG